VVLGYFFVVWTRRDIRLCSCDFGGGGGEARKTIIRPQQNFWEEEWSKMMEEGWSTSGRFIVARDRPAASNDNMFVSCRRWEAKSRMQQSRDAFG